MIIGFDVETSEWGSYSFSQMNTHFYPVDTIICYLAVITVPAHMTHNLITLLSLGIYR